jgi:hypothetical protein
MNQQTANRRGKGMLGLLVRRPWIGKILEGSKTWEIRGRNTKIRGTIALIESGSGKVVGTCELADVRGPLTLSEMLENTSKHCERAEDLQSGLPYRTTYAWVLKNAKPLEEPLPYKHPPGAIIWVKLPEIEDPKASLPQGVSVSAHP